MEQNLNINFIDVSNKHIIEDSVEYRDSEYDIKDCVLIRTTDVFPSDKIIQTPIHGNAFEYTESKFLGNIIKEKINKKYPNHFSDNNEGNLFIEELSKYNICFETCRTTIHFCINGLVGSHAYGNFDNRPYVIIEPFKYHIDESLAGLRVEDTYYNDDMKLSEEAIIMIDEVTFDRLSKNLEHMDDLKKFNVYVYRGDQQSAVSEVLKQLGYDSFIISTNGYVDGLYKEKAAGKMYNFINKFALENNISLERHFYSKYSMEEAALALEKFQKTDLDYLIFILDKTQYELKDEIILLAQSNREDEKLEMLLAEFVEKTGLDKLEVLTKEFNLSYVESLNKEKSITQHF